MYPEGFEELRACIKLSVITSRYMQEATRRVERGSKLLTADESSKLENGVKEEESYTEHRFTLYNSPRPSTPAASGLRFLFFVL